MNQNTPSSAAGRRLGIAALLVSLTASAVWPATGAAQVLYQTPNMILASTSTPTRLAWAQSTGPEIYGVYRRRAFDGRRVRLTRDRVLAESVPWVRMASTLVYWDETAFGNSERDDTVLATDRFGGRRIVGIYSVPCGANGCSPATTGHKLGPIAIGDGALTYSAFTVAVDSNGDASITGGVVRRAIVSSTGAVSHPQVPGAPGAALLAQAGAHLLEVPADTSTGAIVPTATLELRGVILGRLRWSVTTPGTVNMIDVSNMYAVALVTPPVGLPRIVAYDTSSGSLVHTLVVRPKVAPFVGISGPRVVFAYAHWIMAWNLLHNRVHRVNHTQRLAHNLSVAGRLVTWSNGGKILGVALAR